MIFLAGTPSFLNIVQPSFYTLNREIKNYLHRCMEPAFALSAVAAFFNAFRQKLVMKFFQGARWRKVASDIPALRSKVLRAQTGPLRIDEPVLDKAYHIKLVVGDMQITKTEDWLHRFSDAEMNVSIDRWGWLINGIADELLPLTPDRGTLLIRSWSSRLLNNTVLASDAYSTGERISNAALFYLLHDAPIPPDVVAILKKLAEQVAEHIEYLPFGLTGNHAFNNARALYFAGNITGSPDITSLAMAVARERLPVLITEEGFMREGSSHYHFLFTKWLLEMIWYARKRRDDTAIRLFTPYVQKMLKNCWGFLVQDEETYSWRMPLIGDVSPDCSPNWLVGIPWSELACTVYHPSEIPLPPRTEGWARLFGGFVKFSSPGVKTSGNFSSACGWHRVEAFNWSLLMYGPSRDGKPSATHSHHDLCGFELYYKGKPILVDIGRLDYTNSRQSIYGKSAYGHNTVVVDNYEPVIDALSWMNKSYGSVSVSINTSVLEREVIVVIRHDGFRRLTRSTVTHQRTIRLLPEAVEILDEIDGRGDCTIASFLHFGQEITLAAGTKGHWRSIDGRIHLHVDHDSESFATFGKDTGDAPGWIYPSYGAMVPAWAIKTEKTANLPLMVSNKIVVKQ
jgi:hypothetical protein